MLEHSFFSGPVALVEATVLAVWPVEAADVHLARVLAEVHPVYRRAISSTSRPAAVGV